MNKLKSGENRVKIITLHESHFRDYYIKDIIKKEFTETKIINITIDDDDINMDEDSFVLNLDNDLDNDLEEINGIRFYWNDIYKYYMTETYFAKNTNGNKFRSIILFESI